MTPESSQSVHVVFAFGGSIYCESEVPEAFSFIRKTYSFGKYEFDFDTVNGKLELLEVELKDNNASVEAILEFVKKYGLTMNDVTYRGIQLLVKDFESK